jgi:hypothetical protein
MMMMRPLGVLVSTKRASVLRACLDLSFLAVLLLRTATRRGSYVRPSLYNNFDRALTSCFAAITTSVTDRTTTHPR